MGEMSSMRLEESKIKQISLSNLRRNEERYEKQMQQGYNIKMHILKEGYTIPYSFHTDSRIVVVLARRQFDWYLKAEMLHRCMQQLMALLLSVNSKLVASVICKNVFTACSRGLANSTETSYKYTAWQGTSGCVQSSLLKQTVHVLGLTQL